MDKTRLVVFGNSTYYFVSHDWNLVFSPFVDLMVVLMPRMMMEDMLDGYYILLFNHYEGGFLLNPINIDSKVWIRPSCELFGH